MSFGTEEYDPWLDIAPTLRAEEAADDMGIQILYVHGDEHFAHCPMPGHPGDDASPSFSFNSEKLVYNCLAGETLVTLMDGSARPIRDLAGQIVQLLNGEGEWQSAPVRSFGEQSLMKVTLQRNRQRKVVYATPNHRWIVRDGERTTDELKRGHRLKSASPPRHYDYSLDQDGVRHGFVFGDGTTVRRGTATRAYLCGDKDFHMERFFEGMGLKRYQYDQVVIYEPLCASYKALPETDDFDYLYGWLAGYFAADGCVDGRGVASLASARRENLEYVRQVCTRLGISTYGITMQMRKGYGDIETPLYSVRFASGLTPDFFLIPAHRDRRTGREVHRLGWSVVSVEETDRVEEVFCAVVEGSHSFVLDDNLVTGNCFVCGGGNFVRMTEQVMDVDRDAALDWLIGYSDYDANDDGTFLKQIERLTQVVQPGIREYEERSLPWYPMHKCEQWHELGMAERIDWLRGRLIDDEVARHLKLGWAPDIVTKVAGELYEGPAILVPHIVGGDLVGYQRRWEADPRPKSLGKYTNTPDFPREFTLYNQDMLRRNQTVIVVESPMTVARLLSAGYMAVATFGAKVTPQQIRLLRGVERLWLSYDNDEAGERAIKTLLAGTDDHCIVEVVPPPTFVEKADLGDCDDDQLIWQLDQRVPSILYAPAA